MKLLTTLSTSCVLVLAADAAHAEAVVVKGDGTCDFTQRAIEAWEVKESRQELCKLVGPKDVFRLANGDSLAGSDGKCEVKSGDTRALAGTLCMKAPALPELSGSYTWAVSGKVRGVAKYNANGTCGDSKPEGKSRSCTWTVTDLAQRKVTVAIDGGEIKDHVSLSANGQVLDGQNHTGSPLRGERQAPAKVEGKPRVYAWSVNNVAFGETTIYEDGRCSNSLMPGVTCKWVASDEKARLATFTWSNGHQDVMKVSDDKGDELSLEGTSSVGAVVKGRRTK